MIQEGTYAELSHSIVQLLVQVGAHVIWLENLSKLLPFAWRFSRAFNPAVNLFQDPLQNHQRLLLVMHTERTSSSGQGYSATPD
jgi:hypothetical protein